MIKCENDKKEDQDCILLPFIYSFKHSFIYSFEVKVQK
jgi:hypothetical protein